MARLTITLSLVGGEPIPSSESEQQGHNTVQAPKTADTRPDTLRQLLQSAQDFVERRAAELSITEIKDPGAPFRDPPKAFGTVTVTATIED